MSTMTEKMSEAGAGNVTLDTGVGKPKKGDRFRCQNCGMEVKITADCDCKKGERVHFHCCGQELTKD